VAVVAAFPLDWVCVMGVELRKKVICLSYSCKIFTFVARESIDNLNIIDKKQNYERNRKVKS